MSAVPSRDLDEILTRSEDLHRLLADARILVTGGTGFFGRWLLESWTDASDRLGLTRVLVVVARDPARFAASAPRLARHRAIEVVQGDVLGRTPIDGCFDACIHAATAASLTMIEREPELMYTTIVTGTENVLEWIAPSGPIPMLLTSSGAVYGEQRADVSMVSEDTAVGSGEALSAYARGKLDAELLSTGGDGDGSQVRIARCFAFVGPFLPVDTHFAVGNFIADGVAGRAIEVKGDGTPVRSYMYPTDLIVWLWAILLRGEAGRAYNVGSDRGIDLRGLAIMIGRRCGVDVVVKSRTLDGGSSHRYVPSIHRARAELGLTCDVALEEAIDRTIAWVASS